MKPEQMLNPMDSGKDEPTCDKSTIIKPTWDVPTIYGPVRKDWGPGQIKRPEDLEPDMEVIEHYTRVETRQGQIKAEKIRFKTLGLPYQNERGDLVVKAQWTTQHDGLQTTELHLVSMGVIQNNQDLWNQINWLERAPTPTEE